MPLKFDRIYGHFYNRDVRACAKEVVRQSAERYKTAIGSPESFGIRELRRGGAE